jgi:hypothetical protein
MANGNWTLAAYFDERADEKQTAALAAIFGGGEGGRWPPSRQWSESISA